MKIIKFFVLGEKRVGKSSLIDTYLWKLHFGYAYHDHLMDIRRYHIQLVEISQLEELENVVNQHRYDVAIYLLCFNVEDQKSLEAARNKWLPDIWRIDANAKVFLMGLKCDLRDHLWVKIKRNSIRPSECSHFCRYYENLFYMECSSLWESSVKEAFDSILNTVLYNDMEAEMRITRLYNFIRSKFSGNTMKT